MTGRVQGKVALITGAGRGQGRSHAVRLAEEGASIIGVDLFDENLAETTAQVEHVGGRMLAVVADARDQATLEQAVHVGIDAFGHLDVVVANAGILSIGRVLDMPASQWQEMIDVNLSGVWHTIRASVPAMVERREGGSVVVISSTAGQKPNVGTVHYAATKHALIGLARGLAKEVGVHGIRVNAVLPAMVPTEMVDIESFLARLLPDQRSASRADAVEHLKTFNVLPVPWVEPIDVSNAVLWLASDETRYVTGIVVPVDAGYLIK